MSRKKALVLEKSGVSDPRQSSRQIGLLHDATKLAERVVSEGLKCDQIDDMVKCLNSFTKFRQMLNSDNHVIIQEVINADPSRVRVIEKSLVGAKVKEDFDRGELSLGDIYGFQD